MSITLERIKAAQSYLEREHVTRKLITRVRHKPLSGMVDAGRYYFLWNALQQNGQLLETLISAPFDQSGQFKSQWNKFAHACATKDPTFLHGMALMHWEWALELDQNGKNGGGDCALAADHYKHAKYYWMHLLGRQSYWQSFSQRYYQDSKEAPENLSKQLHQQISQAILQHHYNCCRTNFNSGNIQTASFHLRCLCNWNALEDKTNSDLYDMSPLEQEWDKAALEMVDRESESIFNKWVSEWLAQANRELDDPNVKLSRGIRKHYKGALDVIRPYLELVPCNPRLFQRVLLFMLRQANGWCYDAAIAEQHQEALEVIESVHPAIEHLESLLTKPAPNAPAMEECKTLSLTYWLKAQLVDDPERTAEYARLATEWDPSNKQAGNLHAQLSVRIRLDQAQEYIEAEEYQKALDVLEEIDLEKQSEAKELVHSLTTATHYRWGMHCAELANQETEDLLQSGVIRDIEHTPQMREAVRQLEEARDHIALALKFQPNHSVLIENLEGLKQEVQYRPYGIKTKVGLKFFENDEYDKALTALEGYIPEDFPGYDTVMQVRAGCFFRRGIQHANNERFDEAIADLKLARDIVPDNEAVHQQLAELEQIRRDFPYIKAISKAESLIEKERYEDALKSMRDIPSSFRGYQRVQSMRAVCEFYLGVQCANNGNFAEGAEHLEQAAELNPDEPTIREQLAKVRHMQKEAPYIEAVREAQSLMGREQYQDALSALDKIHRDFSDYAGVQKLKAVCEFNQGIQYANAGNIQAGLSHLQRAAKLDPNEPVIQQQISHLRQAVQNQGAFRKVEEVMSVLNAASTSSPLTLQQGFELLAKLEEAVEESGGHPQIVALRDQLKGAFSR